MSYLTFNTKANAEKAQRRVLKIWSYFLKQENGYEVGPDDVVNTGFRNGRRVPAVTTRWDNPRELVDGKWAIIAPDITMSKMKSIPKRKRERFGITSVDDVLGSPFTKSATIEVLETP